MKRIVSSPNKNSSVKRVCMFVVIGLSLVLFAPFTLAQTNTNQVASTNSVTQTNAYNPATTKHTVQKPPAEAPISLIVNVSNQATSDTKIATTSNNSKQNPSNNLQTPLTWSCKLFGVLLFLRLLFSSLHQSSFRRRWRTFWHAITPAVIYHIRNILLISIPISFFIVILFGRTRLHEEAWTAICVILTASIWIEIAHIAYQIIIARWSAWQHPTDWEIHSRIPGVEAISQKFSYLGKQVRTRNQGHTRVRLGATRTIGLFGEWGSGKTTFLRQVEDTLIHDPNTIAIYYDAWRWQSTCPPEFALLNEIFSHPRIMRLAWFKKPLMLNIATAMRSLRITFKGFGVEAENATASMQRFELTLLAGAYNSLFAHLYRSGFSILLLIDEADRCERLYFQNILSLLPRYLNADNSFVVISLVASNLNYQLFDPLAAFMLSSESNPKNAPQKTINPQHSEETLRYQPDLRDALMAEKLLFGKKVSAFKMHALSKFIEESFFIPESKFNLNTTPRFMKLLRACLAEWNISDGPFGEKKPDVQDIERLVTSDLGWSGNPRLYTGAIKSTLPMLLQAIESTHADKHTIREEWPQLLRFALGCFAYLQHNETELLRVEENVSENLFSKLITEYFKPLSSKENKTENSSQKTTEPENVFDKLTAYSVHDDATKIITTLLNTNKRMALEIIHSHAYKDHESILNELCRTFLRAKRHYLVPNPNDSLLERAEKLLNTGILCRDIGELNDAIKAFDECIQLLGNSHEPTILELATEALINKGLTLCKANRVNDAIKSYDNCVACISDSSNPMFIKQAAKALLNKGIALNDAGKTNEAVNAYDACINRVGCSDEVVLIGLAAKALINKAAALDDAGRIDEAVTAFDDCLTRFSYSNDPTIIELTATAITLKGIMFIQNNRMDDAINVFDACLARVADSENPDLIALATRTFFCKGTALELANRKNEAISAFDACIARVADSEEPVLIRIAAKALFAKGLVLDNTGKTDDAVATYDACIARVADSKDPALIEQGAQALVNKGNVLNKAGRTDDAVTAYDTCIARVADFKEPALIAIVAKVHFSKGNILKSLHRLNDAAAAFEACIKRIEETNDPACTDLRNQAAIYRAIVTNHFHEALTLCDMRIQELQQGERPEKNEKIDFYLNLSIASLNGLWHLDHDDQRLHEMRKRADETTQLGGSDYNLACNYALAQLPEEAFSKLASCLEQKQISWGHVSHDTDWDDWRDDPRYMELEQKYGQPKDASSKPTDTQN